MSTLEFIVTMPAPRYVPKREIARYIREAVQGWMGGYEAGHSLESIDRSEIKVRPVKEAKRRKKRRPHESVRTGP